MADLWFSPGPDGPVRAFGDTLHVLHGSQVWAVQHVKEPLYGSPGDEARELRGMLGAMVESVGSTLSRLGAELPEALRQWAEERDRPAAQTGQGQPCLLVVSGRFHLAWAWHFDQLTAAVGIVDDRYLATVCPRTDGPVALSELAEEPQSAA
ncbi:hypothetical protein VSR01_28160 [Actinacidiphila sp. DG2A-62]|uniref:hypothetical protein n=1 Tax=Actinacidiphila sp. DG2A-62 TaxID=3108821 RepID=UPI002DB8C957|nr:hypothetical protein [Actinacidiphila sp. DG2A-62]MEC3997166.1 hypothetical protein [Actinacidiphila sp. DG2A-62]